MFLVMGLPKRKDYKEIPWEKFWDDSKKEEPWQEIATAAAAVFAATMTAAPVRASVRDNIVKACWPIVDLVQGVSYPATYIMISAGVLMVIVGQKSKGLTMIKWASVGYIAMQFVPGIMEILSDVGDSMRQ